jgi:hypothetical protein
MPAQVVSRLRAIMEAIGLRAGFFASGFDTNAAPTPSRRFAGSIIRALQNVRLNQADLSAALNELVALYVL